MTEDEHAVLVAEDDQSSRTATRLFLQRVGYRVGEAADGPGTPAARPASGTTTWCCSTSGCPGSTARRSWPGSAATARCP